MMYATQERHQFQQQQQLKHSAIKLSKRWNKSWLTMWNEMTLSAFIFRVLVILLILGSLIYFIVSMKLAEYSDANEIVNENSDSVVQSRETADRKMEEQLSAQDAARKPEVDYQKIEEERLQELQRVEKLNLKRRDSVRNAFIHAFKGYEEHAFGYDEVLPVTNETNSSWGGFGIMLFDSLDTMLIMELDEQFKKATDWVLNVDFRKDHDASFFEFTIRYIGGLLGAYELSKDKRFLEKAKEMADCLLPAFDTPTGIPFSKVNLKTGKSQNAKWTGDASVLAEYGSFQLEFKYLSHHLNDPTYAEKAQKVMDVLKKVKHTQGLYPVYLSPQTGEFTSDLVTYGGLGDSFYEYILKQYILTGRTETYLKDMYLEIVEGMVNNLVARSEPTKMVFLGEYKLGRHQFIPEMDHLVCFVPGMLALGADEPYRQGHLKLAEQIMSTCYHLYAEQATGIGPERVVFSTSEKPLSENRDYNALSTRYLLRPETVESLFVLYRATHNEMYREWAWKIFQSIEKYCKTPTAFSGLQDVTDKQGAWNNSMQSFFLAETLKYLYLIFSKDSLIPLDEYVFTTEAHPLGIYVE